jgi:hypothetical protein
MKNYFISTNNLIVLGSLGLMKDRLSEISPNRPRGWNFATASWLSLPCIGVLMTPSETVLNRMLFGAYSNANALLAAGNGDFDSTAKSAH